MATPCRELCTSGTCNAEQAQCSSTPQQRTCMRATQNNHLFRNELHCSQEPDTVAEHLGAAAAEAGVKEEYPEG